MQLSGYADRCREKDTGNAISQPQTDRACAKDGISTTNVDDHFPISAFPFPISASVFHLSFPFPFSVSSVSTCPTDSVLLGHHSIAGNSWSGITYTMVYFTDYSRVMTVD